MLTPSASLRAAHIIKDAALRGGKPGQKPRTPNFLSFIFEPTPSPLNCCIHLTTREYLSDPCHPFHIKIRRRVAAFDRNKLHWSVNASVDVAKKKVVRSWVKRRVEVAVREELKSRGWGRDGAPIGAREGSDNTHPLRGALKIFMTAGRKQDVITASGKEVRQSVSGIVSEVVRRQAGPERESEHRAAAAGRGADGLPKGEPTWTKKHHKRFKTAWERERHTRFERRT